MWLRGEGGGGGGGGGGWGWLCGRAVRAVVVRMRSGVCIYVCVMCVRWIGDDVVVCFVV